MKERIWRKEGRIKRILRGLTRMRIRKNKMEIEGGAAKAKWQQRRVLT